MLAKSLTGIPAFITYIDQYTIQIKINGVTVHITAVPPEGTEENRIMRGLKEWTIRGECKQYEEEDPIYMWIYFKEDMNMTAAELYHAVGHEMVHAELYASGTYWDWEEQYNSDLVADARSEMEAYTWNLSHLHVIRYPGAFQEFRKGLFTWTRTFYCRQNPSDPVCQR